MELYSLWRCYTQPCALLALEQHQEAQVGGTHEPGACHNEQNVTCAERVAPQQAQGFLLPRGQHWVLSIIPWSIFYLQGNTRAQFPSDQVPLHLPSSSCVTADRAVAWVKVQQASLGKENAVPPHGKSLWDRISAS